MSMKREPNLELLLRGEVLALSSLDYASQRQAMLEALHDVFRGRYGQRDGTDPGIALIEALAAALDVLGLYHDRFLTESKLGSAVRLQSVARLAEAVGHVPSPRLAARALQFFEAKAEAILPRGTKVAGKPPDAAGNVVFETTGSLSIAPAFNRLPISPLVTRHTDASRVVIELATTPERGRLADLTKVDKEFERALHDLNPTAESEQPTPRDDFQPGFLAMINGLFGLELAGVAEARSGAIALQRGLRASYDPSTTFLHAATQVRHLRMWRPLGSWPDGALPGADEGPELVVFELAERPILHYPDATVPGGLRSSLEVFVFEGADDPGLPSSWPREDAWTEVPDFSASEASDRHYRTFVDDRLHTYLILRRRLGYRVLLSDDALCRVFVRYTPAVGAIESWQDGDGLDQYRTFKLDEEYFRSSLVCPTLELQKGEATKIECTGRVLTWAVTTAPLGLGAKDQILIKNTETDHIFIRTLSSARGRYVSWAEPTRLISTPPSPGDVVHGPPGSKAESMPGGYHPGTSELEVMPGRGALAAGDLPPLLRSAMTPPHEQYLPLTGCFTPDKTEIVPLRDAASGVRYPFWEEFYNRIDVLGVDATRLVGPGSKEADSEEKTIVAKGSIFLFLDDTSQVKPGDFFLIGTRFAPESRRIEAQKGAALEAALFDLKAPWITAEVVQAQEVHGGLVRLRYPTHNEYRAKFKVEWKNGDRLLEVVTQVLAVPLVASVYYGDRFTQSVRFIPDIQSGSANNCRAVRLTKRIEPGPLRTRYGWTSGNSTIAFDTLFLAVAGMSSEVTAEWRVRVNIAQMVVRGHVAHFSNDTGETVVAEAFAGVEENILLEMKELWSPVDSQGQLKPYATLYHDTEWSGDNLGVVPELPQDRSDHVWLTLSPVDSLLDAGHRLRLELDTDARILEADYDFGRYRLDVQDLDLEKVTKPGVQWLVTSRGVEWTKRVDNSNAVTDDNQFHLQVIPPSPAPGIAPIEVPTEPEIRLTVRNNSLINGDKIQILGARLDIPLRTLTVRGSKIDGRYYVVTYDDALSDLDRVVKLVWGAQGTWSSRRNELEVIREEETFWLKFNDGSFFDSGYVLSLKIALDVWIQEAERSGGSLEPTRVDPSSTEVRCRVEDPGFRITSVKARGVRWTYPLDNQNLISHDDFYLDEVQGNIFLFIREDFLRREDELELRLDDGSSHMATVSQEKGSGGYYVLRCPEISSRVEQVSEIVLRRVRVRSAMGVHLTLPTASGAQKPWVITFRESAPLASSTLVYTNATETAQGVEIGFESDRITRLLEHYRAAQLGAEPVYVHVHENQKHELCDTAYTSGPFPPGAQGEQDRNFLTSNASLGIESLLVKGSSQVFPANAPGGRSILICDSKHLLLNPSDVADVGFDVTRGFNTYSQSIVFNSGNFIPVFSAESETNNVTFSLHLTAGGTELKFTRDLERVDLTQTQYVYNVNKTPEGVFTINVLVNKTDEHPNNIDVEVEYAAAKLPDIPNDAEKIYEFETAVLPWDPRTELVLVDSGNLKPGDYLFLHTGAPDGRVPILWTRVQWLHGRVVSVAPPLDFQPRAARTYSLHGLAKVPKPQILDPEYYKLLSEAVFDESKPDDPGAPSLAFSLALVDQLPLDPLKNETLLESLIPGDHLLIWDERWRQAWRKFRASGEDNEQAEPASWFDWPDYQHEAIVKSVDAEIGLVVLEEPLPARFRVVYDYHDDTAAGGERLCPREPDYTSLRVLPYYREPFQGARELVAIGSGNHAKKFPRYLTEIGSDIGLASVPLDVAGTLVSNVEALARDPRSNKWSRWTQFQTIDTAKGGDAAFTMGIELTADQPDTVALSVSFGDGRNGALLPTGADNVYIRTTSVGRWHAHLQKRWPLNVLEERSACAPFATPGTGAMQPNLCLLVEFGDHAHWRPTNGGWPWRPSMTVRLMLADIDGISDAPYSRALVFREITCEEARRGHDGIWVSSYRPGVVQVFFFSRETLPSGDMDIEVWAEPQSRVWSLDGAFYEAVANPEQVPGPESSAQIALLETRGLRAGSLLAFERDDDGDFELATVKEVQHETYSATLTAPLGRAYSLGKSTLRGNLVHVEEGESERQYIGSGDGKTASLRIPLHVRKPVVYSQDESSGDPVPGVQILVDGVTWELRDELGDSGPRDRVYRLDRDPSGALTVEFGDGRNGAIPSRGTDNIEAIVRFSPGAPANVEAGVIDKLRDGNLAVASTRNLLAAAGGREAESPSQVRDTLRQRGLPYSRAITAEDIARLALEVGEVIHARVDPTAAGVVRVVVALDQRRQPDATILGEVHRRLQPQLPVTAGATIEVVGAEQRPVHIVISDIAVEPGYREGDVLTALNQAFAADEDGFFAPRHWSIGRALRLGDLYEALFAVPGVSTARVRWMSLEKPPLDLPDTAGETVEAGPRGVIRCDDRPDGSHQARAPRPANAKKKAGNNDSSAPQDRGSLRFELGGGRP
jgi:hypothetical protein